ncbi:MAG: hypothetical protein WC547_09085, partial [Candidatus Omnitrophota bacterium]
MRGARRDRDLFFIDAGATYHYRRNGTMPGVLRLTAEGELTLFQKTHRAWERIDERAGDAPSDILYSANACEWRKLRGIDLQEEIVSRRGWNFSAPGLSASLWGYRFELMEKIDEIRNAHPTIKGVQKAFRRADAEQKSGATGLIYYEEIYSCAHELVVSACMHERRAHPVVYLADQLARFAENCLVRALAGANNMSAMDVLDRLIEAGLSLDDQALVDGPAINFQAILQAAELADLEFWSIRFARNRGTRMWHVTRKGKDLSEMRMKIMPLDTVGGQSPYSSRVPEQDTGHIFFSRTVSAFNLRRNSRASDQDDRDHARSLLGRPLTKQEVEEHIRSRGAVELRGRECPLLQPEIERVGDFVTHQKKALIPAYKELVGIVRHGKVFAGDYDIFSGAIYEGGLYLSRRILGDSKEIGLTLIHEVGALAGKSASYNHASNVALEAEFLWAQTEKKAKGFFDEQIDSNHTVVYHYTDQGLRLVRGEPSEYLATRAQILFNNRFPDKPVYICVFSGKNKAPRFGKNAWTLVDNGVYSRYIDVQNSYTTEGKTAPAVYFTEEMLMYVSGMIFNLWVVKNSELLGVTRVPTFRREIEKTTPTSYSPQEVNKRLASCISAQDAFLLPTDSSFYRSSAVAMMDPGGYRLLQQDTSIPLMTATGEIEEGEEATFLMDRNLAQMTGLNSLADILRAAVGNIYSFYGKVVVSQVIRELTIVGVDRSPQFVSIWELDRGEVLAVNRQVLHELQSKDRAGALVLLYGAILHTLVDYVAKSQDLTHGTAAFEEAVLMKMCMVNFGVGNASWQALQRLYASTFVHSALLEQHCALSSDIRLDVVKAQERFSQMFTSRSIEFDPVKVFTLVDQIQLLCKYNYLDEAIEVIKFYLGKVNTLKPYAKAFRKEDFNEVCGVFLRNLGLQFNAALDKMDNNLGYVLDIAAPITEYVKMWSTEPATRHVAGVFFNSIMVAKDKTRVFSSVENDLAMVQRSYTAAQDCLEALRDFRQHVFTHPYLLGVAVTSLLSQPIYDFDAAAAGSRKFNEALTLIGRKSFVKDEDEEDGDACIRLDGQQRGIRVRELQDKKEVMARWELLTKALRILCNRWPRMIKERQAYIVEHEYEPVIANALEDLDREDADIRTLVLPQLSWLAGRRSRTVDLLREGLVSALVQPAPEADNTLFELMLHYGLALPQVSAELSHQDEQALRFTDDSISENFRLYFHDRGAIIDLFHALMHQDLPGMTRQLREACSQAITL